MDEPKTERLTNDDFRKLLVGVKSKFSINFMKSMKILIISLI